jgi:hypothetical protein
MKAILPLILIASAASAAELIQHGDHTHPAEECCMLDLLTGEGVSFWNMIFPELNYQAALGSGSMNPGALAVGHHDPDRHGITQQSIEIALGVKLAENIRLFGNYSVKIDQDDRWFDEFEEYYAVISDLPGGVRVRGGRFYPRLGMDNTEHHHSIFFIGENLTNGLLIGEDHLTLYGGEIALPVARSLSVGWADKLTVAFGAIPVDRPETHEEGEGPEALFEAEGAHFQDWAAVADYTLTYSADKATRWAGGMSGAWGHNQADRFTQLYALHVEYLWRPGGAGNHACCGADAGEFFRWRTEAMLRHFGATGGGHHEDQDEHEDEPGHEPEHAEEHGGHHGEKLLRDDFTQLGFNTALSYGFPGGKMQAHLRAEYVSGLAKAGRSERWRISPAVAWYPSAELPFHFKLQYNYDHSPAFGGEHGVFAQFSLTWGDSRAHE